MSDFLTKEDRSRLMSRVKNRGTSAEMYVRRATWTAGFRYRLNVRGLPGSPDLVFPRYRTAVLVQGCFWHGHTCRKGRKRPSSNHLARDTANLAKLKELDWTVFVVWECSLREGTACLLEHLRVLRSKSASRNLPSLSTNPNQLVPVP